MLKLVTTVENRPKDNLRQQLSVTSHSSRQSWCVTCRTLYAVFTPPIRSSLIQRICLWKKGNKKSY